MKTLSRLALSAAVAMASQAALAEPAPGGSVTIPIITTAFTEAFNPYVDATSTVAGIVFEPLAFINAMQDTTHYRLAEFYEYADDLRSITYTLRAGLKWSDGEPLTADDLLFTFELAGEVAVYDIAGVLASGRVTDVV